MAAISLDKKRFVRAVFLTVLSFMLSAGFFKLLGKFYSLRFMESDSDYALLMVCEKRTRPIEEFHRKDYVEFTYHGKPYPQYYLPDGKIVIKEVIGFPGDKLKITDDFVYLNGELIGNVLHTDRHGHPVEHFHFDGTIPEGKVFVMAPHPRSFDSRYWGFVDKSWGLHKCWKIF